MHGAGVVLNIVGFAFSAALFAAGDEQSCESRQSEDR
jgi:hypothetical protein